MTSYHGVVDQAKVRPGEWVVVIGIGGVGLAAIQIANALGARVVAVSRSTDKLAKAREEGAVETVTAGESAVNAIREITGGGAHVSIDAYGGSATAIPGILSLRKGGRHLQLGATGKEDSGMIAIPSDAIMLQELSFLGSVGCPTSSYPGLLSMVSTGTLKPSRLVEGHVDAGSASDTLARMSNFATTGFNVITSWKTQPVGV
jgi:D-arabinose 1-dehydrogenase-like Zn-dependent alcohol dehydrogenase